MNTKTAIYAGSFDPWSFGHQFVLESALQIFDTVHVLVAINPAKKETLDPLTRTQIIANSINPFQDWLEKNQPFDNDQSLCQLIPFLHLVYDPDRCMKKQRMQKIE